MAILEILTYPDQRLREVAKPINEIDAEVKKFVEDMLETMYHDKGLGLAATQVGSTKRVFVMDLSDSRDEPMCFINPEIVAATGEAMLQEGCLSFPGLYANVKRAEFVKVKALDKNGKEFEMEFDYYHARCVLHELDHLNGVLFIDHLSPLKRKMAEKKVAKALRSRM